MTDIQLTGNARVAGLERDLDLTDKQYVSQHYMYHLSSLRCLQILFSNTLVLAGSYQLFSQYGVQSPVFKVEPRFYTRIYSCLKSTGTVTNFSGLLAARFFIGMVEGPMLPSIVLYLSAFYTRQELSIKFVDYNHNISM